MEYWVIKMSIIRSRTCFLKKIFVKAKSIKCLILMCLILLWYFHYIYPLDYDLTETKINLNESSPKIHLIECSGRNIFTLKQLCVIERQHSPKKFKNPSGMLKDVPTSFQNQSCTSIAHNSVP